MASKETKKEILNAAIEITKARVSCIEEDYIPSNSARETIEYLEQIYYGLENLYRKEGIE